MTRLNRPTVAAFAYLEAAPATCGELARKDVEAMLGGVTFDLDQLALAVFKGRYGYERAFSWKALDAAVANLAVTGIELHAGE